MDGLVDTPPVTTFAYSVITWSVNDDEYVSACPRKWINEKNNICKWPKSKKIERKAINLSMNPEEDWNELTNITIVGNYATLSEAIEVEKRKTKATSESDAAALEEIQKRRRIKNKKYRDDSISPPPTFKPRDSPNVHHSPCVSPVQIHADEHNSIVPDAEESNNYKPSVVAVFDGGNKVNVEIDDTLTLEDIKKAQIICEGVTTLSSVLPSETSSYAALSTDSLSQQLSQIMNELKNLKSITVFTMHRVENIEDTLKIIRLPSQCENSPSLLPNLPLMELCQLKSLEEKMADEQFEKQLFNMLKFTGGSRERDCVNRCLEKIFTNYLAQYCSWTGKKNNFKLSSLKIMTTLKLAVRESFPNITDDGFERHVMSWFQHAATRLKREN